MLARLYSLIRVPLLAGILAYLCWRLVVGWPAIATLTVRWSGPSLLGALASGLVAYQCLFLGWLVLLRRAGYLQSRHLRAYARIWWISYLYRYVPGKVLVLVERARLGSAVGIPPAAGAALAVIETLLAILAAAWASMLAVSFYAGNQTRTLWIAGALSAVVLLVLPLGYRVLCGHPRIQRRFPELGSVALPPSAVLAATPPFLLFYLLQGLSFFLWARALEPFPWSAFPGLCGVYALAHLLGMVTAIAPGGLGVREGALSLQLARVLPAGVAAALAVGARVWFLLLELISFGAVMMVCPQVSAADLERETANSRDPAVP